MPPDYLFTTLSACASPGDNEKFTRLYQAYGSDMYQLAYSILLNHTMAEDAVHDACIKMMRRLDSIHEEDIARTKSFLKTIVRNTALTMKKKAQKELPCEQTAFETLLSKESPQKELTSPEIQFLDKDLTSYLRQFIDDLKPQERDCIDLFYFHNQSAAQIADILGISHAAVRKRLQRGRETLWKRLKQEGLL